MSNKEIIETTTLSFINSIVAEIKKGYGITPYTGAGVSARSGIMVGSSFTNYLTWVIYLCVSDAPHDIRRDGWPSQPTSGDIEEATKWVTSTFIEICSRYNIHVKSDGLGEVEAVAKPDTKGIFFGADHITWPRPLVPRILKSCQVLTWEDENLRRQLSDKPITHYLDSLPEPRLRLDSRTGLAELAIRSMFDWRAMLDFLSRVTVRAGRPVIRDRERSVIDSFHQYITHGRKPNLTHAMLAHLAGPLRTRVLITTNFDTLHEEAFTHLGVPFQRHDVTLAQGLPAVETIRATTSIIKLHGSNTGTRADFSLDQPPKLEENETFFHYITGRTPDQPISEGWIPSHLLVIGASGDDIRCLHFIKYLLDGSPDIKIFWICFDPGEKKKLSNYFFEEEYQHRIIVTITDRSDLLLLELYQSLTLTLPKGGSSYHYSHDGPPTPWRTVTSAEVLSEAVKLSIDSATKAIMDCSNHKESPGFLGIVSVCPTLTVTNPTSSIDPNQLQLLNTRIWEKVCKKASYPDDPEITKILEKYRDASGNRNQYTIYDTGLTPAVTNIFQKLRNDHRKETVWIELEDFADVPSVIHELFHIISMHRGLFQLEHAVLLPGKMVELRENFKNPEKAQTTTEGFEALVDLWQTVIDDTWRYLGGDFERYVVCFYGRNVPGSCVAWETSGSKWTKEDYQEFQDVLGLLALKKMNILYVPLTKSRSDRNNEKSKEIVKSTPHNNSQDFDIHEENLDLLWKELKEIHLRIINSTTPEKISVKNLFLATQRTQHNSPSGVAKTLVSLKERLNNKANLNDEDSELRLLHAMSLFRQSRPPSVFFTDPVFSTQSQFNAHGLDSDWAKQKKVEEWLENYRSDGLVWRKPGGNSWMYRDALFGLRKILENPEDNFPKLAHLKLAKFKSRTHFWIARWYFRAFCSSNHESPLLESFYHFYQCIITIPEAEPPSNHLKIDKKQYNQQRIIRALSEWIKVIQLGRPSLLFWLDRPAIESWFSEKARTEVIKNIDSIVSNSDFFESDSWIEKETRALVDILRIELEQVHLEIQRAASIPIAPFLAQSTLSTIPSSLRLEKPKIFSENPDLIFKESSDNNSNLTPQTTIAVEFSYRIIKIFEEPNDETKKSDQPFTQEQIIYHRIKEYALNEIHKAGSIAEILPIALGILKNLMYLKVRLAKFDDFKFAVENTPKNHRTVIPAHNRDSRTHWKQVTILGRTIVDLCSYCPPGLLTYDMCIRVDVLTLHALALGRLGRFYQAHRRLNEAHALLSRISSRTSEVADFSIIELRRSEVHLLQAEQVSRLLQISKISRTSEKPRSFEDQLDATLKTELFSEATPEEADQTEIRVRKLKDQLIDIYGISHLHYDKSEKSALKPIEDALQQVLISKLDDCWSSLETAEHLLSGQVRSSHSWGRLCALKLRLFALHDKDDVNSWQILALRRRQDLHREFSKWLRLGMANWPDDPYRKFRIAWYYLHAKANWHKNSERKESKVFENNEVDHQDIMLLTRMTLSWGYHPDDLKQITALRDYFFGRYQTNSATFSKWLTELTLEQLSK